jgi:hypothetical protein
MSFVCKNCKATERRPDWIEVSPQVQFCSRTCETEYGFSHPCPTTPPVAETKQEVME